jgi:hypothetical protein
MGRGTGGADVRDQRASPIAGPAHPNPPVDSTHPRREQEKIIMPAQEDEGCPSPDPMRKANGTPPFTPAPGGTGSKNPGESLQIVRSENSGDPVTLLGERGERFGDEGTCGQNSSPLGRKWSQH